MTGFKNLYKDAKSINSTMSLKLFQKMLERIPNLSQHKLEDDYHVLLKGGKCKSSDMAKIIRVIFATSARIYLLGKNNSKRKLKIKERDLQLPDNITFLHKCYIEAARLIWINPFLFYDKKDSITIQKNHNQASEKIKEAIKLILMCK